MAYVYPTRGFGRQGLLTFAVSAIVAGAEPYYRCTLAAPIKEFLKEFVKTTTCFSEFAEDPVGLQVAAISVASEVPRTPRVSKATQRVRCVESGGVKY